MTARTAIGWPVLQPDDLNTCHVLVQGGTVTLHVRPGDTCDILMDLVRRYDAAVEPVLGSTTPDFWSYALRRVRESSDIWSEHSGGTAVDIRATLHPRGRRGTFTVEQRRAIKRLLEFYEGTVAWGGDFHTVPDEMHFEINVPPGSALLKRIARKVRESMPMPEEDDMLTLDEIGDEFEKRLNKVLKMDKFTGDEIDKDLSDRAPLGVDLAGARAASNAETLSRQALTEVREVKALLNDIAARLGPNT